jgi:hypothetical protein
MVDGYGVIVTFCAKVDVSILIHLRFIIYILQASLYSSLVDDDS